MRGGWLRLLVTPLLVVGVFGLGCVQDQVTQDGETELALVLLGPIGDWLYPRAFEDQSEDLAALRASYLAGLDSLRGTLPSPMTVAAHWLTPPVMSYETSHGGEPQRFVAAAGIDAVVPAPEDLVQGDRHLHPLPEAFDVPVLATDLALPHHPEAGFARSLTLTSAAGPSVRLLASVDPGVILCVDSLPDEAMRDSGLMTAELARSELPALVLDTSAATWKGSGETEASHQGETLMLPLPRIESHQAAIWRVRGLPGPEPSASLEIVDLVAPDSSPLLSQPATVRLFVGNPIPPRALSMLTGPAIEYDEVVENRRPVQSVEGLAPRVTNETVYTYSLHRRGVLTHRLHSVVAQPGALHRDFSAAIATDAGTGAITLLWSLPPAAGGRGVNLDRAIDALLEEHGLTGLPESPPEATGLEVYYRAVREALATAALLQSSLEDLP